MAKDYHRSAMVRGALRGAIAGRGMHCAGETGQRAPPCVPVQLHRHRNCLRKPTKSDFRQKKQQKSV
jgi:hypothetical protein